MAVAHPPSIRAHSNKTQNTVTKQRPVFLPLAPADVMGMPVMAITSILHRISGIVLFLGLPALLYMLQKSLGSEAGFAELKECLAAGWAKFGLWLLLSAVAFHVIAGVRHLIMDLGHLETKECGRKAASTVLVLFVIAAALLGVFVW